MKETMLKAKNEIREVLTKKIIPFWLERSVDTEYGGYLTQFNEKGEFDGNGTKYIVTQGRMVWGFFQSSGICR